MSVQLDAETKLLLEPKIVIVFQDVAQLAKPFLVGHAILLSIDAKLYVEMAT